MTITDTDAFETMLTHHQTLDDRVQALTTAVGRTVTDETAYVPGVAELIAYFSDEVLPHGFAEEHSIYGARADLAGTVVEMTAEHRSLAIAVEGLAGSPNGPAASEQADQVAALFTAHVAKENEILLPRMLEHDDVHLAELLMQTRHLTKVAQHGSLPDGAATPDPESTPSHVGVKKVTK